jgi:hypothetical protein
MLPLIVIAACVAAYGALAVVLKIDDLKGTIRRLQVMLRITKDDLWERSSQLSRRTIQLEDALRHIRHLQHGEAKRWSSLGKSMMRPWDVSAEINVTRRVVEVQFERAAYRLSVADTAMMSYSEELPQIIVSRAIADLRGLLEKEVAKALAAVGVPHRFPHR